jgi:hypothetical protein
MSREKRPVGHALDATETAKQRRRDTDAAAAAASPGDPSSGGGDSAPLGNGSDPVVSAMRPGQRLKCAVAMGRPDNHVCDVHVTTDSTLAECRRLIDAAVTKPLGTGYGFVSKGLGQKVVPKDEEDKRGVLWECGRTIVCRPDDWLVL